MLKSPVMTNSWGVAAAKERKELKSSRKTENVSYDIVDMRVAISFTDRMFHFLLDGHAHSHAGGDSRAPRALSTLPASQLGSQTRATRAVHY